MSVHWGECEQHGVFNADQHDFCPQCEWYACEWCNAEFETKEMLEKHADWCDRLYLAKW